MTAASRPLVDVDDVRARHPLAEVVASHGVTLRRQGHGWVGCCPFHDDSTASLSVDGVPDRFHCFGCGASGDVIDYIRRTLDLSFRDAVAHLEDHPSPHSTPTTGFPAGRRRLRVVPDPDSQACSRQRGFEINALAWAKLSSPVGAGFASSWLGHHRGIDLSALSAATGGHPLAGYADPGWTSLTDHLRRAGVGDDELVAMDLATPTRHCRLVDTLRSRVVVPVRAPDGRITGFLGRDTTGTPGTPKYRNPSRTPTFDKSTALYQPTTHQLGVDGRVVIVEGAMDALAVEAAAARAGQLPHLGAATTSGVTVSPAQADHVLGLSLNPPLLALDGDTAGAEGTDRWLTALGLHRHRPAFVLRLPDGLDPADWLADRGPAGLPVFLATPALTDPPPGLTPYLPGRHLVRLALTAGRDPIGDVVEHIAPLTRRLGPAMAAALTRQAVGEMTRTGWNPHNTFQNALTRALDDHPPPRWPHNQAHAAPTPQPQPAGPQL